MHKLEAEMLPISAMTEGDARDFCEYVWSMKPLNLFDREVLTYPRTVMLRAKNEEGNQLFIPLQSVLMYDSIAPRPGLSPMAEARALSKIGEVVDQAAQDSGVAEVYFFCRDDRVADLCSRHGYEEIRNVRVLKKKISPANPTIK